MPDIAGLDHISLTVRDLDRSAAWYSELFGFTKVGQVPDDGQSGAKVLLYHPASKLVLGLSQHQRNPGEPFSEFRTGLDHLALAASSREDLEQGVEPGELKHWPDFVEVTAFSAGTFPEPLAFSLRAWVLSLSL